MKKSFLSIALATSLFLGVGAQAHDAIPGVSGPSSFTSRILHFPQNHPYITTAAVALCTSAVVGASLMEPGEALNVALDLYSFSTDHKVRLFTAEATFKALFDFRSHLPESVVSMTQGVVDSLMGCSNVSFWNLNAQIQCLQGRASVLKLLLIPSKLIDVAVGQFL